MIKIRIHGRGGQGAVVASKLLADAVVREGKDVQSYPFFGVERRGAPVTAFVKIDDKPIRDKSHIYEPDYIIVLDPALLKSVNVTEGLIEQGLTVVNINVNDPERIRKYIPIGKIAIIDATAIAIKYGLGSKTTPIVNTAILGAFTRVASDVVKLESVIEAIQVNIDRMVDANIQATREAYERVIIEAGDS